MIYMSFLALQLSRQRHARRYSGGSGDAYKKPVLGTGMSGGP